MERHGFAQLIAFNKEGEFLMQHRSSDAPKDPNKWDLFGGGMEEGESPEEGVTRELMEELELDIGNPKLYLKTENVEDGVIKVRYYFEYQVEHNAEYLKERQHEGQNLGFFSPEELSTLDIRTHQVSPLRQFIEDRKMLI